VRREVAGEEWGGKNVLGEVPFGELANRPRMLKPGASELRSVTGIQDRINKTIADRMMTQEFAAFPQKWVTGMEIPVDENGQDIEPFDVAVNKILIAEENGAKFGQFAAADLTGYLKGKEADVHDIAAITSTPPHYLLGSMVNLSAEALKAAEAGLIHKIYQRRRFLEEGLERTMRLAGFASSQARIVWKSPEWRTEGELVDALVKMARSACRARCCGSAGAPHRRRSSGGGSSTRTPRPGDGRRSGRRVRAEARRARPRPSRGVERWRRPPERSGCATTAASSASRA
jgi:hypothetical protein